MTLREIQLLAGAVLGPSSLPQSSRPRSTPVHFGSSQNEYAAATTGAALFDVSDRALLELSGGDRVRFLHSFCTNDIKRLREGQGCEAFVANVKGRALGHVWVDVGQSSLWLDADAGSAERLIPHLERYVINEDVAIADRGADWGELLVMGPASASRLEQVGINVRGLANLDHVVCRVFDAAARVRRFDVGPQPAYALFLARDCLGKSWQRLRDTGIEPAGSEAWNALRIEAGLPDFGVDFSEENLAQEVGRTKTAISFTKGCYLGQEPIARLDAMGHVNRELRSLRVTGEIVPPPGSRVFGEAAASAPVGTVTSSVFSHKDNSPVAMAQLRSNASACGREVFVESHGLPVPATVFWYPLT